MNKIEVEGHSDTNDCHGEQPCEPSFAMVGMVDEDQLYEYYTADYGELPITFRRCKATDVVEMLVDDNFAKANGYDNLRLMAEHNLGYSGLSDSFFERFRKAYKWVVVTEDGQFIPNGDGDDSWRFSACIGEGEGN